MERTPISPEQVEGKEFVVTLRGYDKVEVEGFLREVAADYRSALARAALAETGAAEAVGPVAHVEPEVVEPETGDDLEELSDEVTLVLDAARKAAWDLQQRAEAEAADVVREAEQILVAARREADAVVSVARTRATEIADKEVEAARERLRKLAATERVARGRLAALQSVIEQTLALPGIDPGVLDIAEVERELAGEAAGDAKVIDLRDAANATK